VSASSANPVVVPLVFRHGCTYGIKCYTSRVAITSHDDFDGWGRSWSLGERSGISTSRANHVQDVHISTPMVDAKVATPSDAVEVSRDITVGLVWGDDVTARRDVGEDETVVALDFGERSATTWQHLENSPLWFGSDVNGHLASIVATCATRRPRDIAVTFRSDHEYEAALYGDRSFDVHASEPFDEDRQLAMHEEWPDRDDDDEAPSCGQGIHVQSEDGDADLSVNVDGGFSYFEFNGTQTLGTVSPPPMAERVDRIEVKTSWPTTVALRADCKVQDEPKVLASFGDLAPARWVQLGDHGPWLGVTDDGYLAEMVLTDVSWQSQDTQDDEDIFDYHSPERFEAMMAEQEARQERALAKVSFPVYGLAGNWDREHTAQLDDDDGPTPRSASVELTYGTQKDMSLPYVEVKTSNEPWQVAELRKGKVNEFAFESLGWLSHLTRFPIKVEHSSRAEAAEWFAEGRRQEQELSQRPWDERTLHVDGEPHTFHVLQHKHGWIARGVVGDLAVDVRVLHLAVDEVALETVPDLLPFIQGRKDQFAEVAQMRQKWASVEDNVPTWAKDARREAQRACRRVLSRLMDNDIRRVLDATSEAVVDRRGGRDGYRLLLSLYIAARGFCGYGGPSMTWTNEDGTLVGMVARMSLAPEHRDSGGTMMIMSTSSSDEPNWWGLTDDDVYAQANAAAGEFDALDDELPVPLVFRREGDGYKLVSDIVDRFEEKLGDPASIVKPK
jgi:hypothetical protein